MSLKIAQILNVLQEKAPFEFAEKWDHVGLLVGDIEDEVDHLLISLDLTVEVIALAQTQKVNCIVTHHPCLFPKGENVTRWTTAHVAGQALKMGINVIALHTNFDRASCDLMREIARWLGVLPQGRLLPSSDPLEWMKLTVMIPKDHVEVVSKSLFDVGVGAIGPYEKCGFSVEGEGTYLPQLQAKPFIGEVNQLQKVEEIRFEALFLRPLEKLVKEALKKSHPYQTPSFEMQPIHCVHKPEGLQFGVGYGFWGTCKMPMKALLQQVAKVFQVNAVWVNGVLNLSQDPILDSQTVRPSAGFELKEVSRCAYSPGAGSSMIEACLEAGCEVLITGEVGYHASLKAAQRGLTVIEVGHAQSERFFASHVGTWFKDQPLKVTISNWPGQQAICT